uniref:HTH_Tnp_Tc3_2 domain-containing protein n=1 Tax=Caenorhabditis japonica TaxID=281687 RepID=A0A8R1HZF7_CAEJA
MDRNILRACREDPRRTSTDIEVSVTSPNEPVLSRRTIRRRLQVAGLHGRRPVKKPLVSLKNRKARVEWAEQHLSWGPREYAPQYQCPTVKHGGGSVMVWGCFFDTSMGPLRRIVGTVDRYVYEDILENTNSNANQKFAQLKAAWKSIPMTVVQTLLDSMPRRCQAVIDVKGYPSKY